MKREFLRIFLFFTFISSIISCNQYSTDTSNKIVFERGKKVGFSEALNKEKGHLTSERVTEISKAIPFHSQIVIMDEDGKNQRIIIEKFGKEVSVNSPVWFSDVGNNSN